MLHQNRYENGVTGINLGEFIKKSRCAKEMTQIELAAGICTQPTISNLENMSTIPTLRVLLSIADKLNLDIVELLEYLPRSEDICNTLQHAKNLLWQLNYAKVKWLLVEKIDRKKLLGNEMKEYHYYMGKAILKGEKNYTDAIHHFNLGLQKQMGTNPSTVDILIFNAMGTAYLMGHKLNKAEFYFEKVLDQLREIRNQNNHGVSLTLNEYVDIYCSTAYYYSFVGNYKKAIELYSIGISLQRNNCNIHGMESMYYEKGINLVKIKKLKEAKKEFFIALGLCEINKNEELIGIILRDSQNSGLGRIVYERK